MKNLLTILVVLLFAAGCIDKKNDRFSIKGYCVEQKIDDKWFAESIDDEIKFKFLKFESDSNFHCRSIADTIWTITISGLKDDDANKYIAKLNSSFSLIKDNSKVTTQIGKLFECYQYMWFDSISGDEVNMYKCKGIKSGNYGGWEIEVSNKQLLSRLKTNHYPSFRTNYPMI